MLKRLPFVLAVGAAIFALALAVSTFFDGGDGDLPLLPRLAHAGEVPSQHIPGLPSDAASMPGIALPDAPTKVAVYHAVPSPIPSTPEEAVAWARDFGLPDPKPYQDPQRPDTFLVRGSDGAQLEFWHTQPKGMIHYAHDSIIGTDDEPLSFDQAAETAVAFLDEHGLLPAAYRVITEEQPENIPVSGYEPSPIQQVSIAREIDGRPLLGQLVDFSLAVAPDGRVTFASFSPFTYERGDSYPIKSAEEAYAAFRSGTPALFRMSISGGITPQESLTSTRRYYQSPPITYTIDMSVDVTGRLMLWIPEDDAPPHAEMSSEGITYELVDVPRQSELSDVGDDPVRVRGVITAQVGTNHWQVTVTDWERVSPRDAPWVYGITKCFVGTFVRGTDRAELVTGDGERYGILYPPQDLADGERIVFLTDHDPAPGDDVRTWFITASPSDADLCPGDQDSGADEAPRQTGRVCSMSQPEASGDLGQHIVLTGTVSARVFITDEGELLDVYLYVQSPDETESFSYSLAGTRDILEKIIRYNHLHVRLWGHIIPTAEEPTSGEPTIAVECFEMPWPDERLQAFLGHSTLETLDGRDVVVFTDRETGQRYVTGPDLDAQVDQYTITLKLDETLATGQYCALGVVHPVMTHADLPILSIYASSGGTVTEIALTADECNLDAGPQVIDETMLPTIGQRLRLPPSRVTPVPETQPGATPTPRQGDSTPGTARDVPPASQDAIAIDRVELAYYYHDGPLHDAPIIQPVWVFEGRAADGSQFTAYVQAVREEYLEDAGP